MKQTLGKKAYCYLALAAKMPRAWHCEDTEAVSAAQDSPDPIALVNHLKKLNAGEYHVMFRYVIFGETEPR